MKPSTYRVVVADGGVVLNQEQIVCRYRVWIIYTGFTPGLHLNQMGVGCDSGGVPAVERGADREG